MKSLLLLLTLFILGACGQKTETTVEKQTTETTTKVTPKTEIKSFQYKQNFNGVEQEIIETITYTGDSFDKLHFEVTQPFDESIKASLNTQDFTTLKTTLIEKFEGQEAVKQFKEVDGANFSLDITEDKGVVLSIDLDMKKVDLTKLSSIQGLGVDFTELEKVSPEQYITLLQENGATELK